MSGFEDIKKEYEALLIQLSDPELISNWPKFEELSKKKTSLEKVMAKAGELESLKKKIEENKGIIAAQEDQDLVSLAEAEIVMLQEKEKEMEKELLSPIKEENEEPAQNNVSESLIMEIRAGTGGEEAAIFAANLHEMYSKYAALQGWKQKTLDSSESEMGGYKEVVFEMAGKGAFQKMQHEAGVHRVQRIPATEKAGRIHTSTASVAVLLKPKETQFKINPSDLKTEVCKASGPGGQNVNKRMTAVRILHIPTGLAVESKTERNLQQNKESALAILSARLLERQKEIEQSKTAGERRNQIGGAKRAEKIRTYNFPQDRVTDHRIKKSFHNIEAIMEGKIDQIVEALAKEATVIA
jgi:peptide chain release factor 1